MNKGEKYIVKLNKKTAHFGADYLPADDIYEFVGYEIRISNVKMLFKIPNEDSVSTPLELYINGIEDIKTL